MWKFISSFFWQSATPETDLDVDNAYELVKESIETDALPEPKKEVAEEICDDYELISKTGRITSIIHGTYTVDGLYEFKSELETLNIGSTITYQLIKTAGVIEVINVNLIDNDWDVVNERKSTWCTRTLIFNVRAREGRTLILMPQEITVDLNKVCSEFVPIEGDWLHLDVKCEVDEQVTDLTGKILEIIKIMPVRPHVKLGSVTSWNSDEKWGVIDKKIFFSSDSLQCGYIPMVGDKVVCEIIESSQDRYNWRVLKLIPDYLKSKTKQNDFNALTDESFDELPEYITVTDNVSLSYAKIGEIKIFSIEIENKSSEPVLLKSVEFPKSNSQCSINNKISDHTIAAEGCLNIKCDSTAKFMGETTEALNIIFENFKVRRWIKLQVGQGGPSNGPRRTKNLRNSDRNCSYKKNLQYIEPPQGELIRGRKVKMGARFSTVQISSCPVPEKIKQLFSRYNVAYDRDSLQRELERTKPVLITNLTYMNYEDKFHTLIHLEEMNNILEMQKYDRDRACFIRAGEYLLLEIENLSEKRPSIIGGDRVIATSLIDPTRKPNEAFVHKVGKNHVFLKFSQLFHDSYNGEDYSIRVIAGRATFQRQHHAISLVVRNLGRDILFPSKVDEKPPQIELPSSEDSASDCSDEVADVIKTTSPPVQHRKQRFLDNIRKFQENTNGTYLKIEWYNSKLNYYQKQAVKNVIYGVCRPLPYIIFGPPGTGKTVTLVETSLQILRLIPQSRLLIAAPSNSAADLIALRLIDSGVLSPGDLVRLVAFSAIEGIPVKLAPYCATLSKEKEGTESGGPVRTSSGMILGCSSAVLGRHRITVSTCSSAGLLHLLEFQKGHFSHIIVDEAGQTEEPSVMIPLSFLDTQTGQAILAGDPNQLGPVILSQFASHFGLDESFLERMINRFPYIRDPHGFPTTHGYDPRLITKLIYNYRSLPSLLKLPSALFYNDDLLPTLSEDDSEEAGMMRQLQPMLPTTKGGKPVTILFHGVVGENFQTDDSPSWFNPAETALVFDYVDKCYRWGLTASDIGIITPYKAQSMRLHEMFKEAEFSIPKIGTVEEFQGQEYNVIIMSTVRSVQKYVSGDIRQKLGFVSSPRRLNVSITRAKVLLIIIGNPLLLKMDRHWLSVIKYCADNGGNLGTGLE